jgi:iron(III) transport system ATP-binding protein
MENVLHVKNISKAFGNGPVINNVSFSLKKGNIGCLLGPSGCGKTTLLRIIAGFENTDKGAVILQGRTVSDETATVKPEKRNVGMVFQDYALFPHLSVNGNIAFGLHGQDP